MRPSRVSGIVGLVVAASLCGACSSAEQPTEGRPLPMDLPVEYEPKDLVEGRDNVLEAAVKALLEGR